MSPALGLSGEGPSHHFLGDKDEKQRRDHADAGTDARTFLQALSVCGRPSLELSRGVSLHLFMKLGDLALLIVAQFAEVRDPWATCKFAGRAVVQD